MTDKKLTETPRHFKLALAHTSGIVYEPDKLTLDHVADSDTFINISAFNEGGTLRMRNALAFYQSG